METCACTWRRAFSDTHTHLRTNSAHIYVRLEKGKTITDLPEAVIEECCQLTKANSIEGCKLANVKIVYTPWANLKKTSGMAVGQVRTFPFPLTHTHTRTHAPPPTQIGFHKGKEVRSFLVAKKKNEVVNRLERSKVEKVVDFRAEREQRDKEERHVLKMADVARRELEKAEKEERKKSDDIKNYVGFMDSANMTTNKDATEEDLLDDFM